MRNNSIFPKYLSIQTTSLCNASCIFCPYEEIKKLYPKKIMDNALYRKIIDESSNYKNVERIILYMNNEPLTDPHLIERINYAKEKVSWANVHILTNGSLLTDEMIEKIINSKLDWIGISFHGIRKDTVEKSMGIPFEISFRRILDFIDKAKTKRDIKEFIMITFLKHKYLTEEEKEEAINFWKSKGINRISYFEGPISRAGNVKDLPKVYHKENIVGCNSIWTDEMLHILEDGKAVLCCMDWRREVILGDLSREDIYQIWNGRRKEIWDMIRGKREMPDNFLCKRCEEAILENKEKRSFNNSKVSGQEILLVIFPCWGIDTPPLGLASIGSYLKSKGIDVKVLDLNLEIYHRVSSGLKKLWEMDKSHLWWMPSLFYKDIQPLIAPEVEWAAQKIINYDIDIVGVSVYATNRLFTKEVIKKIKENCNKTIIAGGRGIYDVLERENFPKGLVDYFIIGEGEEALYKFLKGDKDIDGLISDLEGEGTPIFLKDLVNFPLITYEDFDLSKYREKTLCLLMNRGCIFQCAFCNDWRYIGRLRTRKAEDIYKEIEYHFYKNNIKTFYFNDQAINVNLKELNKLCDLLIKAPFKIEWTALAIPWRFLSFDLLFKMKKAGCITLNYGIESGSNKVLKLMNKDITAEDVERVLEDTTRARINTQVNFIVGFPGETEGDFRETKEFIKRNLRNISGITNLNMCNAVLGSDLVINKEKFGILFPENTELANTHWFTKDGSNTYQIRLERLKEILGQVKGYGLSLFTTNLQEAPPSSGKASHLSSKNKPEVLLLVCPMWDVSLPPLGLAYLASYLESKGIPVDILDINVETYAKSDSKRKELWRMENYNLWGWKELFEKTKQYFEEDINYYVQEILKKEYKMIGFSLYGANILFSIELATMLKRRKPDLFIIFGGPSCSFLHNHPDMPIRGMVSFKTQKSLVEPGVVNAFVIGEGEEVLFNLIDSYYLNNISPIPGAILYLNKKYTSFSPFALIKDLDQVPYPLWEKFHLNLYSSKNTLSILLGRGCINRCTFCNDWIMWGKKYRNRSALNVFKEIELIIGKFKVSSFQANDLIFNANLKILDELADYLIKSNLKIQWSAQGIIRRDMHLSLLKKLKKSGLNWITYGLESLSENVLKMMGKRYNFRDIQEVLKNTKEAGISISVNFIVGFPNETEKDFKLTKERLLLIKEYIDEISSLNPCYITNQIDLESFPQNFSVKLPRESYFYYWETLNGKNTYELRKERTKELLKFIKKLGIKVHFTGIYDEGQISGIFNQADIKKEYTKRADFIVINLPPWAQENPHIGIGYLGSYLRIKGFKMKVIDLNKRFYLNHSNFKMLWHVENKNFWSSEYTFPLILEIFKKDIEKAIDEVLSFDCNLLGFSVVDPKERLTIEFIRRIKKIAPNKNIILGGPATSTFEQRKIFLDNVDNSIDAFVIGEGEETLFHLLDRFLNKKEITDVEGCYVRNNGRWVYTRRPPMIPLDRNPFPTYEEFDMELYGKSLLVEWSRGCRGRCAFCKNYRLFPIYRKKSVDWIIDELRHHKERYNIDEFTVVDNILNGDLNNLNEICNRIIKENLKIGWTGQIAPHENMDFEFFKKMRKAGCFKLQIGLESGSNKVLKLMRKTFTSEISEKNIRFAKKAGIETEVFIMIGFPGETEKDFKKTFNFIKRNAKYIDTLKSINTLHLIAGTEVYENREKFGIKPLPERNWHYLWQTYEENNYKLRKRRAQTLLDLAYNLGIKVMETNISEGKEDIFEAIKDRSSLEEGLSILKDSISSLQELPQKRKIIKIKRSIFKWLILILVSFYIFFYIVYFWVYMILKNKILLGGRRR